MNAISLFAQSTDRKHFRSGHEFPVRVATCIINDLRGICRVIYDITSKPPGSIEWE
jgi:GMP synthase PP-ATPase subunit